MNNLMDARSKLSHISSNLNDINELSNFNSIRLIIEENSENIKMIEQQMHIDNNILLFSRKASMENESNRDKATKKSYVENFETIKTKQVDITVRDKRK